MMLRTAICSLALLLAAGGAPDARAASPPAGLDQQLLKNVVAGYLVNFANHVRWPAGVLAAGEPLTIAVLGRDPFGATLDRTLAGRTAAGHPLRAVRVTRTDQLAGCQIVFMDQPTKALSAEVAAALAEKPVLVIAFEAEGGGSSALVDLMLMRDNTVRYKLSVSGLKRVGLTPSAGLLQQALTGDRRAEPRIKSPP
jgi:hypothetical protein